MRCARRRGSPREEDVVIDTPGGTISMRSRSRVVQRRELAFRSSPVGTASMRSAHAITSCSTRVRCSESSSTPGLGLGRGPACGRSRRAGDRARASNGAADPRPRASSSRAAHRRAHAQSMRCIDASTNGATRSGSACLGTGVRGPASTCSTAKAGLDLHHGRLGAVLGPGVDVAFDAGARERARERPVTYTFHPPTVAGTGAVRAVTCASRARRSGGRTSDRIVPNRGPRQARAGRGIGPPADPRKLSRLRRRGRCVLGLERPVDLDERLLLAIV